MKPHCNLSPTDSVERSVITSVFVYHAEDFSDNEEMFAKEITKWSSNDLMDKIETTEVDEAQGRRPFVCVCYFKWNKANTGAQYQHVNESCFHRNFVSGVGRGVRRDE